MLQLWFEGCANDSWNWKLYCLARVLFSAHNLFYPLYHRGSRGVPVPFIMQSALHSAIFTLTTRWCIMLGWEIQDHLTRFFVEWGLEPRFPWSKSNTPDWMLVWTSSNTHSLALLTVMWRAWPACLTQRKEQSIGMINSHILLGCCQKLIAHGFFFSEVLCIFTSLVILLVMGMTYKNISTLWALCCLLRLFYFWVNLWLTINRIRLNSLIVAKIGWQAIYYAHLLVSPLSNLSAEFP